VVVMLGFSGQIHCLLNYTLSWPQSNYTPSQCLTHVAVQAHEVGCVIQLGRVLHLPAASRRSETCLSVASALFLSLCSGAAERRHQNITMMSNMLLATATRNLGNLLKFITAELKPKRLP
jgi:hypothetical protein